MADNPTSRGVLVDLTLDNLRVRSKDVVPRLDITKIPPFPEGRLCLNTIDGKLYYSFGRNWVEVSGTGSGVKVVWKNPDEALIPSVGGIFPFSPVTPLVTPTWYYGYLIYSNYYYTALTHDGNVSGGYIVFTDGQWPSATTRLLGVRIFYESADGPPAPSLVSGSDIIRIQYPSSGDASLDSTAIPPPPVIVQEYPTFTLSGFTFGTSGIMSTGVVTFDTPLDYVEGSIVQVYILLPGVLAGETFNFFGVQFVYE